MTDIGARPPAGPNAAEPGEGRIEPGLHIVATPIGAARDITLRALDILSSADVLLAEDTRSFRRLIEIHGVRLGQRPLWAYHDHNGASVRPRVLAALDRGQSVALVSEAGTPLIADPGFQLVRAAVAAGHRVRAAPGASALLAALAVSGLPTDRFAFLGFPPTGEGRRKAFLNAALGLQMTVVIYESPRRIHRTLASCCDLDPERPAAVCRELTKRFEEVIRGSLAELVTALSEREVKGEVVLVIGAGLSDSPDTGDVDAALLRALEEGGVRQAAEQVAGRLGLPRRQVYQRALELAAEQGDKDETDEPGGT